MEARKAAVAKSAGAPQMDSKKLLQFFGDTKQEFKNVAWTPKDELLTYTKVVVCATFLFGMFIYVVDLVIQGALQGLNLFMRLFGS